MISITSLQDAENGTLFHMDCSFLSPVRYVCESPDTVCLIFSEKPENLPDRVFLMPDGRQYDYRAFIYTLSEGRPAVCGTVCRIRQSPLKQERMKPDPVSRQ